MDHTLNTPVQQQQINPQPSYQHEYIQKPAYSPQPLQLQTLAPASNRILPSTTKRPSYEIGTHSAKINELNTQCGVPMNRRIDYTGLVVHGFTAMKGQVSKLII